MNLYVVKANKIWEIKGLVHLFGINAWENRAEHGRNKKLLPLSYN